MTDDVVFSHIVLEKHHVARPGNPSLLQTLTEINKQAGRYFSQRFNGTSKARVILRFSYFNTGGKPQVYTRLDPLTSQLDSFLTSKFSSEQDLNSQW